MQERTTHPSEPRNVATVGTAHIPHLRRTVDLMRRAVSACRH
ncbi:hypothetical protein [Ornithinimicrobium cavernae]|nr:hypothetical protein [Ornithinimicrobium cavernae]